MQMRKSKEKEIKEVTKNEPKESKEEQESKNLQDARIKEFGQTTLVNKEHDSKIHLLTIIGEIEGHENLPQVNKTTKYEHVLPQLAAIEDDEEIEGVLIILNTIGGDVESGLAISEMISTLSKKTVTLVLGGSHSIGVPLAVSSDYSFIVPSATMIIHPVRMSGMVIGVAQTYEYFERMQDRIIDYIVAHSRISRQRLKDLMLNSKQLAKDIGSILGGEEAVQEGLINEIGGINQALSKLYEMIEEERIRKKKKKEN